MEYRIETIVPKKLVGKRMKMSLATDKTWALWHSFMPRRKEIISTAGKELFSVKVYDPLYFDNFNPNAEFEKWAAIEVTDFVDVPREMEMITHPGGLYAVFNYKGAASEGAKAFRYIFAAWLPKSKYVLDNRPHFDLLGEKYKNDDPDSEEELWIPIKPR